MSRLEGEARNSRERCAKNEPSPQSRRDGQRAKRNRQCASAAIKLVGRNGDRAAFLPRAVLQNPKRAIKADGDLGRVVLMRAGISQRPDEKRAAFKEK